MCIALIPPVVVVDLSLVSSLSCTFPRLRPASLFAMSFSRHACAKGKVIVTSCQLTNPTASTDVEEIQVS